MRKLWSVLSPKKFVRFQGLFALLIVVGLCAATPAQAGWVITHSMVGQLKTVGGPPPLTSDLSGTCFNSGCGINFPFQGGVTSMTMQGTYKATLTWQGTGAPAAVPVKVTSTVGANGGGPSVPTLVDNGFDDPLVFPNKSGVHLLMLPVSNGVATFTKAISASFTGGYMFLGGFGITLTTDSRSVTILSSSFGAQNYHRWSTPLFEPHDALGRVENTRNVDGSIIVDSVAAPFDSDSIWFGAGIFTADAAPSAVWNTNGASYIPATYKWSLSGGTALGKAANELGANKAIIDMNSGIGPDPILPTVSKRYGLLLSNSIDGADLVKNSTIKVKVTGGVDRAQGENSYTIRWHKTVEAWEETGTPVTTYTELLGTLVDYEPTSTYITGTKIKVWVKPATWKFTTLLSTGEQYVVGTCFAVLGLAPAYFWSGTVPTGLSLAWKAALAAKNIQVAIGSASDRIEECENSDGQFLAAVDSTRDALSGVAGADKRLFPESYASNASIATMHGLFEMTPWVKRTTKATFFKADEYGVNGYVGPATGHFEGPETVQIVGHYQLIGSPNGE